MQGKGTHNESREVRNDGTRNTGVTDDLQYNVNCRQIKRHKYKGNSNGEY
jgi:hypothetical protein